MSFEGGEAFKFTLTKPLLQSRVQHFLRSGSRRLWQPEILGAKL
jgi:hypothetical protein